MRLQSTLTAKEVRTLKVFERSRRSSSRFGRGNELASFVYRSLREEDRAYPLYCQLKTMGILLLKKRKTEEEVVEALYNHCEEWKRGGGGVTAKKPKSPKRKQSLFYFTGSEDMPLRLSRKDILDLEQGTHEDMLRVVEKLKNRLAAKKKRKEKAGQLAVVAISEVIPVASIAKPIGRKIVKPVVLRPQWRKAVCQRTIPAAIIYPYVRWRRARAPAFSRQQTPKFWEDLP